MVWVRSGCAEGAEGAAVVTTLIQGIRFEPTIGSAQKPRPTNIQCSERRQEKTLMLGGTCTDRRSYGFCLVQSWLGNLLS